MEGVVVRSCRIFFDEGDGRQVMVMVYCGGRWDGDGLGTREGKGRIY